MLWSGSAAFGPLATALSALVVVLQLVVVCLALIRPHRTPASRVAWIAVVLLLPVIGILAYLFLGETSIGRRRVLALRAAEQAIALPAAADPPRLDRTAASAFRLVQSINGFFATGGNRITLAATSEGAIDELVADIDAATASVHISFYIWLDDGDGGRVADAVAAAARRGVTCRIMVDALGSKAFTRSPRWAQLRDAGAHVVAALDDVPRLGHLAVGRPDLRNHRKIVVIDGRVAFCGSRNCADAAFRVKPRYAPWVDVFFRCEGPVVAQEQWLFLTSWRAETDEPVTADTGTVSPGAAPVPGGTDIGAMFGTGPTSPDPAMSEAFVTAIASARETLTITTPYFAPDSPLLQAICAAPQRGVATTLILPAHNDSKLVATTARSVYGDLLQAGVELYEYPLGLLHAKTMTIDDRLSLVGSANMDRRSLQLNYENNLLVNSPELTAAVRARQQEYLAASRRITPDEVAEWSWLRRLGQNAVAMLSPIL